MAQTNSDIDSGLGLSSHTIRGLLGLYPPPTFRREINIYCRRPISFLESEPEAHHLKENNVSTTRRIFRIRRTYEPLKPPPRMSLCEYLSYLEPAKASRGRS